VHCLAYALSTLPAQPTNPAGVAAADQVACNPPPDGITSLSFHPTQNYLVATSWDNQVRAAPCVSQPCVA
jgi:hypothetical protein